MGFWLRLLISSAAIAILVSRMVFPQLPIDAVALGLLVLAVLPWITSLLDSAELPGGIKITFRQVREAGDNVISETASVPHDALPTGSVPYDRPPFVFPTFDPNLTLVNLRIEIEKRLRALIEKHGLREQHSLTAMFRQLREAKVLNDAALSGLQELIQAGNKAAHGAQVEDSVAAWVREYGPEVLGILDAKVNEK